MSVGPRPASVRAMLIRAGRLIERNSEPDNIPVGESRRQLEEMAWFAAVRSVSARPATMAELKTDLLLVLVAAYGLGKKETHLD